jgi:biopolymer transport protein ExbD
MVKKPPAIQEDVQCNLIPMIDIMFLLLLFFMLSADMTQREFEEIVLPRADQVKEEDPNKVKGEEVTVLNIYHRPDSGDFSCPLYAHGATCRDASHWLIAMRGASYTKDTVKERLKADAEATMEPDVDPAAGKRLSARKVMIRADRQAPYGDVQGMIQVCGEVGIYKIEVAAAQPPKE